MKVFQYIVGILTVIVFTGHVVIYTPIILSSPLLISALVLMISSYSRHTLVDLFSLPVNVFFFLVWLPTIIIHLFFLIMLIFDDGIGVAFVLLLGVSFVYTILAAFVLTIIVWLLQMPVGRSQKMPVDRSQKMPVDRSQQMTIFRVVITLLTLLVSILIGFLSFQMGDTFDSVFHLLAAPVPLIICTLILIMTSYKVSTIKELFLTSSTTFITSLWVLLCIQIICSLLAFFLNNHFFFRLMPTFTSIVLVPLLLTIFTFIIQFFKGRKH